MPISGFLKLVEIQTKVASIIPFLLGTFYALYRFDTFNLKNFILMFVSLLCIDMATTAINNYQDFKGANKKRGYGYEKHNAIVRYDIKESTVVTTIFILLTIAIIFGILLFLNTDFIVLLLGSVSFLMGVFYSSGPIPISRTPFGEIFSGGFMGFIIPFISVYIHVFNKNLITISLKGGTLGVGINLIEVIYIFLISIPLVVGIANIMLANNICDIEDDIENRRYTLPVYIGKSNALKLFTVLYFIGYMSIIILLILKIIPLISIIVLGTFILVYKHVKIFYREQTKQNTFVLAVKNFIIMNSALVLTLGVALIIKYAVK